MDDDIEEPVTDYNGRYTYRHAYLDTYGDSLVVQLMDIDFNDINSWPDEVVPDSSSPTDPSDLAREAGESSSFPAVASSAATPSLLPELFCSTDHSDSPGEAKSSSLPAVASSADATPTPVTPVKGPGRSKHEMKRSLHRKQARMRGEQLGTSIASTSAKITQNMTSAHVLRTNRVAVPDLPVNLGGTYAIDKRTEDVRRERDNKEPIPRGPEQPRTMSDWVARQFGTLPVRDKRPRVICDRKGRILALFITQDDPAYTKAVAQAHEEMISVRRSINKVPYDQHRGTEPLNTGWYMGTGTTRVVWKRAEHHPNIADQLRASDAVKRVVGVGSKHLKYWFPHDHEHLRQLMIDIEHHTGSSERTFPGTVFSMVAFNLGEQSCAILHRDNGDCRRCIVTAAGDFDATQGGHMVLYDLRLLVEFPPGWTAIFPSGLLNHANTLLQRGETRTSIVQYTPGQLSQFRDAGWRTQTSMSTEELATRWVEKRAIRASFAESFLTLDQVKQRHEESEDYKRMVRKNRKTNANTQSVHEQQYAPNRYHPYQPQASIHSPTIRAELISNDTDLDVGGRGNEASDLHSTMEIGSDDYELEYFGEPTQYHTHPVPAQQPTVEDGNAAVQLGPLQTSQQPPLLVPPTSTPSESHAESGDIMHIAPRDINLDLDERNIVAGKRKRRPPTSTMPHMQTQ